jgi:hypothetical protein
MVLIFPLALEAAAAEVVAAASRLPTLHPLAAAARYRHLLRKVHQGQAVPLLEPMVAQLPRLPLQRFPVSGAVAVELSLLAPVVLAALEQGPAAAVVVVGLLMTALPQEPVERVTMAPYSSSVNRTRRV